MSLNVCCRGIRIASRAVRQVEHHSSVDLPAFLCPALLGTQQHRGLSQQRRKLHTTPETSSSIRDPISLESLPIKRTAKSVKEAAAVAKLPPQCPGCGAITQTIEKDEPGFYNLKRQTIRHFLEDTSVGGASEKENAVIEESLKLAAEFNPELAASIRMELAPKEPSKYRIRSI